MNPIPEFELGNIFRKAADKQLALFDFEEIKRRYDADIYYIFESYRAQSTWLQVFTSIRSCLIMIDHALWKYIKRVLNIHFCNGEFYRSYHKKFLMIDSIHERINMDTDDYHIISSYNEFKQYSVGEMPNILHFYIHSKQPYLNNVFEYIIYQHHHNTDQFYTYALFTNAQCNDLDNLYFDYFVTNSVDEREYFALLNYYFEKYIHIK